ncbi:unnamed protein product, partial [Effrenium voratum]
PRTSRWRVSRSCRSCRPRRARDPSPRRGAPAVGLARGIGTRSSAPSSTASPRRISLRAFSA